MSYYIAKVQLVDTVDTPKGSKEKKVTETYLVEALSVTEAEAKVVKDFDFERNTFTTNSNWISYLKNNNHEKSNA